MPSTDRRLWFALSVAAAVGCRDESVVGPFGLRLRERPGAGPVAAAIRRDAAKHAVCPTVPLRSAAWTVRTLTHPAGRVSLPPNLQAAAGPSSEITFFATDMSAGAFVIAAPSLATLEIPRDSPLTRSAITTCRVQAESVASVVALISQPHPASPGDSVHLAFLQVAVGQDHAVRAGAFATTRALRDSLVGALLAFEPGAP